jgi:hypothetical protein
MVFTGSLKKSLRNSRRCCKFGTIIGELNISADFSHVHENGSGWFGERAPKIKEERQCKRHKHKEINGFSEFGIFKGARQILSGLIGT